LPEIHDGRANGLLALALRFRRTALRLHRGEIATCNTTTGLVKHVPDGGMTLMLLAVLWSELRLCAGDSARSRFLPAGNDKRAGTIRPFCLLARTVPQSLPWKQPMRPVRSSEKVEAADPKHFTLGSWPSPARPPLPMSRSTSFACSSAAAIAELTAWYRPRPPDAAVGPCKGFRHFQLRDLRSLRGKSFCIFGLQP
jgi:hypothetical protein